MSGLVRLSYVDGRGLAEVVRIALGAAEIEFEEQFIMSKESLEKLRGEGKSLFNQIPLLEIDGLHLVQCMPIVRYICRKRKWLGQTDEETVRIDMLSEGARDLYTLMIGSFELQNNELKFKESAMPKIKERYLSVFDKVLDKTGTGYLVGGSITMCDIVLLDAVTWIAELHPEVLEEFPNILNFLMTVTSLPAVQKFLDGPQRKPVPDGDYAKSLSFIM